MRLIVTRETEISKQPLRYACDSVFFLADSLWKVNFEVLSPGIIPNRYIKWKIPRIVRTRLALL